MPSTIQFYDNATSNFQGIQKKLVNVQSQIGADSKASTFQELGSDINALAILQAGSIRSERYASTIETVELKLDEKYQSV